MLRTLVAGLALVAALLPAAPAAAEGAGIELTVAGSGGRPLEGVQVRWDTGEPASTRIGWTDAAGKLVVFDEGTVSIRFEPIAGHAIQWLGGTPGRTGSETVTLRNGSWLPPREVRLQPGGTLAGRATLADGSPVDSACALIRTPSGDLVTRAWGGADGSWGTRDTLLPGDYVVELQHCASPATWSWHGGTSRESAARVTVAGGRTTPSVDTVLDPAGRPGNAIGRPSNDAELAANIATLNRWRAAMGLRPVEIDPVAAELARLHARYLVHNPDAGHDEDPRNPWFTVEGMLAAQTSELGTLSGLSSAPFHWLPYADPYAVSAGGDDWIDPDGQVRRGAWHATVRRPAARPASSPVESWPVHWPADGMVSPELAHWGESPGSPADSCPGYTAFPMGMPAIVQFDPHGEQVQVVSHEVEVNGARVESCAFGPGTYDHPDKGVRDWFNGDLASQNAVMILPRHELPEAAIVETSLTTNLGSTSWSYETPIPPRTFGSGLLAVPGDVTVIGRAASPRASAIALSRALYGEGGPYPPFSVVLCREDVFADCLATSLWFDAGVALLLTPSGAETPMPADVRAELERLNALPHDQPLNLIVAGGPSAISNRQTDAAAAMGMRVFRFHGGDRTQTAAYLANGYFGSYSRALLTRADDWADAITAGAYAAAEDTPILLTHTGSLAEPTRWFLSQHPGLPIVIIGGGGAVSEAVAQEIRAMGHPVTRIAGGNRILTALELSKQLWQRTSTTTEDGFAFVDTFDPEGWTDALLAAAVAPFTESPVLVTGAEPAAEVLAHLDEVVVAPAMGMVFGPGAAAGADALRPHLRGCARNPDRPSCR